nr:ribonuclease H-like domain-containing protein [Tanacetum cinerariifolium]
FVIVNKGVIDGRYSRHMTRNRSYLTNYEEIDEGFVAFGGNSKGGKITGKVPRKDNMYSVDLKNVVPQGGLTCLFAKATSDESTLWHMRLGHVNFKTINKMVKGNLVRGNQSNGSAVKARVEIVPDKDYILLPLRTQDPLFSSSSKDSPGDGFKPLGRRKRRTLKIQ